MIYRCEFRAMGSRMMAIMESPASEPPEDLQNVPAWFEEWEQALSRFRSDSELCQLNIHAGSETSVSQTLWDVYQESLEAERLTNGLVTPLIYDALVHAGYDRSFDTLFDSKSRFLPDLETAQASLNEIIADENTRSITLPRGARLDFGGIAKGWAAHQAAQRLGKSGPALVDAGGDIEVTGPLLNGEPWAIGVENPFERESNLEVIYLDRGGVATSGKDYHRWMRNGVLQHHIIDPRTGLPAETDVLTATVIASTAMEAEAMAKFALISGSQSGMERLNGDDQLAGLIVLENGQYFHSRNFEKYL
jgi:thiamine biosynthesis lipoprotein